MGVVDILALVAAMGLAGIAFLGVHRSSADHRTATRGDLLRYTGVAALSGLASLLMYVADLRGGGLFCLAIANAAMAFTAGMLWAALRRVNGRAAGVVPSAAGSAIAVLGATYLLPVEPNALKLVVVAVFCTLAGIEALRGRCRSLQGAVLIAAMAFPYAAFTAVRLFLALALGIDSAVFRAFLSTQVSTAVSVLGIVAVCIAVFTMGRGLDAEPAAASGSRSRRRHSIEAARMLRHHGSLVGLTISAPDLALIRTAFGAETANALVRALERATAEALPGALVGRLSRDGAFAVLAADADHHDVDHHDVDRAVRAAFVRQAPRVGESDLPELRITHRGIGDATQLARFFGVPLPRRVVAQPAAPEG